MTKHKKRHYLDKIQELEPQYNKHVKKLEDARKAGSYTKTIESELKAWKDKKNQYERRAERH